MHCAKCGLAVREGTRFCIRCGAPRDAPSAEDDPSRESEIAPSSVALPPALSTPEGESVGEGEGNGPALRYVASLYGALLLVNLPLAVWIATAGDSLLFQGIATGVQLVIVLWFVAKRPMHVSDLMVPRLDAAKAARANGKLAHTLLAFRGADGYPVVVPVRVRDDSDTGAILRTAAAFAVTAVVTTARHSPEATGVLAKSASGALEYVPLVTVQNLARALAELKERGYLTVGLDITGDVGLADTALRAPLALVLGAEGKGLRQLTRATCEHVARLDLPGRIKSLNVSNAAALALYIASARLT